MRFWKNLFFCFLFYLSSVNCQDADVPSNFCLRKPIQNPHPNKDECGLFVTCLLEIAYVMKCPGTLHWNRETQMCDYPENAGCKVEATTTTTTTTSKTTTTTKDPSATITPTTFVPGKREYEPAIHCDFSKCVPPNCWCGGEAIPGGLKREETPQMVIITFDDAIRESNFKIYKELFDPNIKNPNGCPMKGTFFVSNKNTNYDYVESLYKDGHEMADHSVTKRLPDTWWKTAKYEELESEIIGQKKNLERHGVNNIVGWRSPLLATGENTHRVLADNGFLYTSSIQLEKGQLWWPYTLDYLNKNVPNLCPTCPKNSYPGLWEIPLNRWNDIGTDYVCSHYDACSRSLVNGESESVYKLMKENFLRFYNDRKQPFNMFGRGAFYDHSTYGWKREGFKKFIREINQMPDVYIVTATQAIRWMQNPTPLNKLKTFKPWLCN